MTLNPFRIYIQYILLLICFGCAPKQIKVNFTSPKAAQIEDIDSGIVKMNKFYKFSDLQFIDSIFPISNLDTSDLQFVDIKFLQIGKFEENEISHVGYESGYKQYESINYTNYSSFLRYLENLPTSDIEVDKDSLEVNNWSEFLTYEDPSLELNTVYYDGSAIGCPPRCETNSVLVVEPPNISAMFKDTFLHNNVPIAVTKKKSRKPYGKACCVNGKPIIELGIHRPDSLNAINVTFMLYHELAHHLLGHLKCDSIPNSCRNLGEKNSEINSDCHGAELLLQEFCDDGKEVVIWGASTMYQMKGGAKGNHPSWNERATTLMRTSCGGKIPEPCN